MDRTMREKETEDQHNTVLYTLLRCTRNIFWVNHMLGPKGRLNSYKKIDLLQSMFDNYNGMVLKISNRRKTGKFKVCGDYTAHFKQPMTNVPKKKPKERAKLLEPNKN